MGLGNGFLPPLVKWGSLRQVQELSLPDNRFIFKVQIIHLSLLRHSPTVGCRWLWLWAVGCVMGQGGPAAAGDPAGHPEPALRTHAQLVGAWQSGVVDPADAEAVRREVVRRMPDTVDVFPTENYAYWQLLVAGRELRGNFRLPPHERAKGVLLFAYSEFEEFPEADHALRLRRQMAMPVLRRGGDDFTWMADFPEKTVIFRLHRLSQAPPVAGVLREGETFVQRTADESGLLFLLVFDEKGRVFRWVLDPAAAAPETWRRLAEKVRQGRRSGFVFRDEPGRSVLVAVRRQSAERNDYYDGPFDQLADNFAHETKIRAFLERWQPDLAGHIDDYGAYTDERAPKRVAIDAYSLYSTLDEARAAALKP